MDDSLVLHQLISQCTPVTLTPATFTEAILVYAAPDSVAPIPSLIHAARWGYDDFGNGGGRYLCSTSGLGDF
mgnify:CR=1